ncbi:MAG TPA: VOC family protein [Bacillaceae bacterium]
MAIIQRKIGAVFIPVSDIEQAREWYCKVLEVKVDQEIIGGHLCCIPLENDGLNLVLDSKISKQASLGTWPIFHFNTTDINKAHRSLKERGVTFITNIQHGHYFNIKDPDGNMIMICKC